MNRQLLILLLLCFLIFSSCSSEKKDWEKAESENTIESYQVFLKSHTKGPLADKAREVIFFKQNESINTVGGYMTFLKQYPQGPLADKARIKLEELYFTEAQSINTIPAFEAFIKQNPQGTLLDEARKEIETLKNLRHQAFRHTRTAKIIVEKSFWGAEAAFIPFEDHAKKFIKNAGLHLVETDDDDYDVVLKLQAKGEPRGASYIPEGSGGNRRSVYRYTGASLSGTVILEVPGLHTFKKTFKGEIKPSQEISIRSSRALILDSPSSAPFDLAYSKAGVSSKLLEMMGTAYGYTFLLSALKDGNWEVSYYATKALGELGDPRAVEPLITALKDEESSIRRDAADSLKNITGEDFGEDQEKWQKWWKENKEKFLKKK
ncbi:MAG: HEAT repeat domain-containing protein [Candidatus Aminicenantaceae bacterium]